MYRQCRVADKSISPLEIKIMEKGTFNALMDYAISLGAATSQYKTPRAVKFAPFVHLLNSTIVLNVRHGLLGACKRLYCDLLL